MSLPRSPVPYRPAARRLAGVLVVPLLFGLLVLGLSGCGSKGDLVRPAPAPITQG
jgi:hypothetical protein